MTGRHRDGDGPTSVDAANNNNFDIAREECFENIRAQGPVDPTGLIGGATSYDISVATGRELGTITPRIIELRGEVRKPDGTWYPMRVVNSRLRRRGGNKSTRFIWVAVEFATPEMIAAALADIAAAKEKVSDFA